MKSEILFFFYFLENPKKFRGEYTKNQEKIVKEGKGEMKDNGLCYLYAPFLLLKKKNRSVSQSDSERERERRG